MRQASRFTLPHLSSSFRVVDLVDFESSLRDLEWCYKPRWVGKRILNVDVEPHKKYRICKKQLVSCSFTEWNPEVRNQLNLLLPATMSQITQENISYTIKMRKCLEYLGCQKGFFTTVLQNVRQLGDSWPKIRTKKQPGRCTLSETWNCKIVTMYIIQ